MGKLGVGTQVLLVCRNLNLLENKTTVRQTVADTYRWQTPTGLDKSIHCLEESV